MTDQTTDERIAAALERIAAALELANYQRAFPPQPVTTIPQPWQPPYPTTITWPQSDGSTPQDGMMTVTYPLRAADTVTNGG